MRLPASLRGSGIARVIAEHHRQDELDRAAEAALLAAYTPPDSDVPPPAGVAWKEWYGTALGRCGAKTRSGTRCALSGTGRGGRCKFHGGLATGPKTPEGKLRSARNGPMHRKKETMPMQPQAEATAAPDPASAAPPPPKRVSFLELMLDQHLAGERRWPLADSIFRAVEARVPPTRAELVAELPAPGELIVRMLEARGMLAERAVGRRIAIVRVDET